ncbi:MAG: ABC transporter ATP-binding protein [Acidimicrobiales bacterium]
MTTARLLELDGVSRVFGDEVQFHALSDVSLRIAPGEFVSVMGPSGSGKSTMLGLLGLLDLPSTGTMRVEGHDVLEMSDRRRSELRGRLIGFVFQQFHLIPYIDARRNVETALLYRRLGAARRRRRAMDALDLVGLADRAEHRPAQLSGGEQQRVAIARAIVTEPMLVLADEPTGALDSVNADMVMSIFSGLNTSRRAVVLVTHDPGVAAAAKRRIVLRDGRVVADVSRVDHRRSDRTRSRRVFEDGGW